MSKYNYPNWYEIKDLVSIYREDEWNGAKVVVWDPSRQKEYNLMFCGSSKPGVFTKEGSINFVIYPTNPTWFDRFLSRCTLNFINIKHKISKRR